MQRILSVQYSIPDAVQISTGCHHLISRIFVADPAAVSNSGFSKNILYFLDNHMVPFLSNSLRNLDTLLDAIVWVPLRYLNSYVLLCLPSTCVNSLSLSLSLWMVADIDTHVCMLVLVCTKRRS